MEFHMTISLNVTKGETISLSEKAPNLTKAIAAAGWDQADAGKTIDVDLFAVVLDQNGKSLGGAAGIVYFGSKTHASGALVHGGDNLTGAGDGDDETIQIDLSKVPADAKTIRLAATIYQAAKKNQTFSGVNNEFIRLVNAETNAEILRYSEDFGAFTTFTLADLKRVDGGWSFTAIGEGSNLELQDYVNAL
jgi:tellurium resistance protein TerD